MSYGKIFPLGGSGGSTPSGIAGAIQFSNGSAFASDAANLFFDDTNNRLGVGTNVPSATTHIKGSGSTSATTSLLVQNSAGSTAFLVRDDNVIDFNVNTLLNIGTVRCNAVTTGFINSVGNAFTVMRTNNSNGNATFDQFVSVGKTTDPVASAALEVQSTTKGFLPPRMTTTQRDAIVTPAIGLTVYNTSTNTTDTFDGTTFQKFGQQTLIKGSGSTSATTSLLVQNSSGTNLISVVDNGNITQTTGNATFYNGVTVQFSGIQCNNNGPINTGGNITATGTSSQIGQLQILSTGNASTSGLGISFPEATMVFQGYTLGATSVGSQFTFRNFNNTTSPLNFINSGLLRITSIGFQSGNANNLSGNTLWIEPIYNLTDPGRSGTTVRGIYYNPTLTSLVNTNHYGIQTTSGGAYINTATPAASAALQADSTTQGFLPPRMTTAQKNAIATPAEGLIVMDITLHKLCVYSGTAWETITSV